jgi:hypothetical protein
VTRYEMDDHGSIPGRDRQIEALGTADHKVSAALTQPCVEL